MKRLLFIGILVLTACTQFTVDPEQFSQEQMAHSAGVGSMYLTSSTYAGNHNCDDTPSGCCASGYHMCTVNEIQYSGLRIEYSGTDRDTTPVSSYGDAALGPNDCTGWSSNALLANNQWIVDTSATWSTTSASTCATAQQVWCCSN